MKPKFPNDWHPRFARHTNIQFYKKTVLVSKAPITEIVKGSTLWICSGGLSELVELEDGASDVVFVKVPFLPELPGNLQEP